MYASHAPKFLICDCKIFELQDGGRAILLSHTAFSHEPVVQYYSCNRKYTLFPHFTHANIYSNCWGNEWVGRQMLGTPSFLIVFQAKQTDTLCSKFPVCTRCTCNFTGSKKKNKGIKILDEEPGVLRAQSVHLLSPGRLELPAHHATQTDKLPPLAPPHNLVCHHSRHVPRDCFSYLCGNMTDFCIVSFFCVCI